MDYDLLFILFASASYISVIVNVLSPSIFAFPQNLRVYFPTSLCISVEKFSVMLATAFNELAEINGEPIFNIVPVLGAGRSASMDDIITCELFAQKS